MPIPTKTKIILMQSIDPSTGEESGTYETVREDELEVGPAVTRAKAKPRKSVLGTPATLIFPGNAIPANVRQMALAHLQASRQQADDSGVMAVANGDVPIVKRIGASAPRRGVPGWVAVAAAAAVFVGVSTAALAKSTLFHPRRAAAAQVAPLAAPAPDTTTAVNAPPPPAAEPPPVAALSVPAAAVAEAVVEPEPISIMVPSADLKPEPAAAPKAVAEASPPPEAAKPASHARAHTAPPADLAPRIVKAAAVAPVARPRPAPLPPKTAAAPAAPPSPASSEADELAKLRAVAKQQLGEVLP